MTFLSRIYTLFNILSLDVSLGAVCMAWAACLWLQIEPDPVTLFLLGNAVWIIYTIDHLYDATIRGDRVFSKRRAFHSRYKKQLFILVCLCVIAEISFLFHRTGLLLYTLPAFIMTSAYILFNWYKQRTSRNFYLKEMMIALGYASGIMAVPLYYIQPATIAWFYLAGPFGFIFITALLNVVIIAMYEAVADMKEKQTSMGLWVQPGRLKKLGFSLLVLQFLISLFFIPVITQLIGTGFLFLLLFRSYFSVNERYRKMADGVLMLPSGYILYHLLSYL